PPRPPPSPRPAPSPPPAPPGSRLTWRPPPTPLSPPLPPPGPGQRAFPSTATCAPYTPRGSASTPLAVSPCTTIPVTALIGSTTGTTPPPKVPTPRGRCCTTSASTMTPVATCRPRRSPYASTDIPSPGPVTLRSAPAPGPSRPTHC